jgi:hypothetical protein
MELYLYSPNTLHGVVFNLNHRENFTFISKEKLLGIFCTFKTFRDWHVDSSLGHKNESTDLKITL